MVFDYRSEDYPDDVQAVLSDFGVFPKSTGLDHYLDFDYLVAMMNQHFGLNMTKQAMRIWAGVTPSLRDT